MGTEIRKQGSGNAGTTNVLRVLGRKAAIATLAIDVLKGVAAVLLGRYVGGQDLAMICGLAAFVGHIWPILFGFRGGKGIATAFGVMVTILPMIGILEAVVFVGMILITKRVSAGSVAAAVTFPFVTYYFIHDYVLITVVMAAIALYKHRLNIVRLVKGQEPKVGLKK